MFLPQQTGKITAILVLIAGLTLVLLIIFARFLPGTFTSLNRAFFRNHALGEKKKGLDEIGRAATKTVRTRTGAKRAAPPKAPGDLPAFKP